MCLCICPQEQIGENLSSVCSLVIPANGANPNFTSGICSKTSNFSLRIPKSGPYRVQFYPLMTKYLDAVDKVEALRLNHCFPFELRPRRFPIVDHQARPGVGSDFSRPVGRYAIDIVASVLYLEWRQNKNFLSSLGEWRAVESFW